MSALKYPETLFTSHYLCFAIYNLLFMIDLITELLFYGLSTLDFAVT